MIPNDLVAALLRAERVAVLTGAGISAESGVPTFREAGTGLWSRYDPHDLATPEAFARNPLLVWDWYRYRQKLVREAEPNDGHRALVTLSKQVPEFALITQNVDGLHQRAGSPAVTEFHGNLFTTLCSVERKEVAAVSDEAPLPTCPDCGALLRPGVVWFGEAIPEAALETAVAAAAACDVFLSIGTSSLVQPAAGLADLARGNGGLVVEINPNPTELAASADFAIAAPAGKALPALVNRLSNPRSVD